MGVHVPPNYGTSEPSPEAAPDANQSTLRLARLVEPELIIRRQRRPALVRGQILQQIVQ